MPFITQERRKAIAAGIFDESWTPGDLCYIYYKDMVERWRQSPSWTMADRIYQNLLTTKSLLSVEATAARELAWQVFFQLHVMPYELKKREENGDI